jgi:hypothetical protein
MNERLGFSSHSTHLLHIDLVVRWETVCLKTKKCRGTGYVSVTSSQTRWVHHPRHRSCTKFPRWCTVFRTLSGHPCQDVSTFILEPSSNSTFFCRNNALEVSSVWLHVVDVKSCRCNYKTTSGSLSCTRILGNRMHEVHTHGHNAENPRCVVSCSRRGRLCEPTRSQHGVWRPSLESSSHFFEGWVLWSPL